jgi:hypothetical protein
MRHKILALFILISGMSMVACSDDKPAQQGASNCLTNPTLPGCSLQKAALAQVPGSPEQAAALLAANKGGSPALGQVQPPGTTPDGSKVGIPVASVSKEQLKAQAAKIAEGLKQTSENPLSSYWQAPDESGRSPASVGQPVVASQQQPEAPAVIEGSGDAAR